MMSQTARQRDLENFSKSRQGCPEAQVSRLGDQGLGNPHRRKMSPNCSEEFA